MAKSLRSSANKTNNKKLRSRVFRPVEDARTARLSAKLMELASQPRPNKTQDGEEGPAMDEVQIMAEQAQELEAMELDASSTKRSHSSTKSKKSGRIHKSSKRKARNMITFPSVKQRRSVSKRSSKR